MRKYLKSAVSGIAIACTLILGSTASFSPASAKSWHHGSWNRGNVNHGHWNYGGWGYPNYWVGPAIGFGTGLFLGAVLAQPRYRAPVVAPRRYNQDAYCHARFRSYNSYTHTYLGYDGHRHYC